MNLLRARLLAHRQQNLFRGAVILAASLLCSLALLLCQWTAVAGFHLDRFAVVGLVIAAATSATGLGCVVRCRVSIAAEFRLRGEAPSRPARTRAVC